MLEENWRRVELGPAGIEDNRGWTVLVIGVIDRATLEGRAICLNRFRVASRNAIENV